EPLHRKNGSAQRVVPGAGVGLGAVIEQDLDELEVVHVRQGHRKVAAFNVPVIRGQIKRRPCSLVGEVYVGSTFDQVCGQFVVPVIRRDQQGRPAVVGDLVHVGAGIEQ